MLKDMSVVTVVRFREAALAENAALKELARVQHEALKIALYEAESWIHDQLGGTPGLDDALGKLEPACYALTKYNDVMGENNE